MSLRIIDNKRIDMTEDEFQMYKTICENYTKEHFDGKQLFVGLFETDEDGIIIYLKPPTKMFSMEVLSFLQNLMVHQHLRRIYSEFETSLKEMNSLKTELISLLENFKNKQ